MGQEGPGIWGREGREYGAGRTGNMGQVGPGIWGR